MQSELDLYRQLFIQNTAGLGYTKDTKYEKLDENILVKGYCKALDNHDDIKKNQYYAALMLRYWYKIYKYKESCKFTRLDDVEYINWLNDAFDIVFKYRSWEDPEKGISKDPKAIDKIINRCCFSVRGLHYQNFNKDKRRLNFLCNSIEESLEAYGDASPYNAISYDESISVVDDVINYYLTKNKTLEAVVIDNVAYQDSFREVKKVDYLEDVDLEDPTKKIKIKRNSFNYNFDYRKLIKNLRNLNEAYFNYFENKYNFELNREEINNKISSLNSSSKMYNYIEKTFSDVKNVIKGWM